MRKNNKECNNWSTRGTELLLENCNPAHKERYVCIALEYINKFNGPKAITLLNAKHVEQHEQSVPKVKTHLLMEKHRGNPIDCSSILEPYYAHRNLFAGLDFKMNGELSEIGKVNRARGRLPKSEQMQIIAQHVAQFWIYIFITFNAMLDKCYSDAIRNYIYNLTYMNNTRMCSISSTLCLFSFRILFKLTPHTRRCR